MLRINRNTSALTVSLLFGLLSITSCGFDDGYDKEDTGDDNVKVAFRMAFVNDNTRAVNDGWQDYDPTDPGDAYENAINADQLQIKVCKADGTILADVENVIAINVGTDTAPDYKITGTWKEAGDKLKEAKKIMVFANCGETTITQTNIADLAFDRDNTKKYIPMWGVTTLTADLQVGKENKLGTIDLLRSLAKVKVTLAADMAGRGYSLGEVRLNNYNTKGYMLPLTYYNVANTQLIRFDGSLHAYSSWASPVSMTGDRNESITLYIPEYDNLNTATDKKATISLQLMRNNEAGTPVEEGNYTLQFCDYTSGSPSGTAYNIQRNHFYEYTVGRSNDKLNVVLSVKEWNKRTHSQIVM